MASETKQKYLDEKYAYYNDEEDAKYKKKTKKKRIERADHKHVYKNCVIIDPLMKNSFNLRSVCIKCGKINNAIKDNRLSRKFPNVLYVGCLCSLIDEEDKCISFGFDGNETKERFVKWCKRHYPVFELPRFNELDYKYV